MVRALFVSVCLFAVVGCGGSTRRTGSNPAQADCYFYVENELCPTLLECGATYASLNDCINTFETTGNSVLACDSVTAEYSGLSACEAQTNQSYCDDVVDSAGFAILPPACYGVFN
jgi:hypothetical protein